MASREIRAGKAFVEVGAVDKLGPALAKMGKKLQEFGNQVKDLGIKVGAVGAAMTAPFAAAAMVFNSTGSALADMSARTGAGVESLSALGFAAEQSGGSAEDVEKGMRKLAQTIDDAANGGDAAAEALAKLGTSAEELKGLSPDKQMAALADGLARLEGSERTAAALEVLGRGGAKLIPILSGGAEGLAAMAARAEELGIVVSGEAAGQADAFGDALSEVWKQAKMVTFWVGSAIAESIMPWMPAVNAALKATMDFVKGNKRLIMIAASVAVGVVAVGGAITAVGFGIIGLGAAFTAAGTVIGAAVSAVTGLFGLMGTVFTGVVGLIGGVLAAVMSPIGLVVAAVVGLGAAFLYFSGMAGKAMTAVNGWVGGALGYIGKMFQGMWGFASEVFGALVNALTAGDLEGAMKLLMATWGVIWSKGVAYLMGVWNDWGVGVVNAAFNVYSEVVKYWNMLTSAIEQVMHGGINRLTSDWDLFVTVLADGWDWFSTKFMNFWSGVYGVVGKVWAYIRGLFDESVNVGAEVERIDKEVQAAKDKRNAEMGGRGMERGAGLANRQAARDEATAAAVSEADRALKQRLAELEESRLAFTNGLKGDAESRVAEAEAALEAARAAFKGALDQANSAKAKDQLRYAAPALEGEDSAGKGPGNIDMPTAATRTTGSFNASLVSQSLGLDDGVEKNTRKTFEELIELRKAVQANNALKYVPTGAVLAFA
jgi:hypothetical protein